jgi:CHASE1-domain containing sensor protein
MKKTEDRFLKKKDIAAIIIIAGGGILLSGLTFVLMQRIELRALQNKFIVDAGNYSTALKKSIDADLNSLHAVEGLYASSPQVTRARFHTFASNILSHSNGTHALRWAPRVAGRQRAQYEAEAVREGQRGYHFTELNSERRTIPAEKRDEYFPIYFSEPAEGSEAVLGLDLWARAAPKAALEKARDEDTAVASSRITLLQENTHQFSFVIFQPIYVNGLPHDTVQERRKNLLGFVVGVFRFGDMVGTALSGIDLKGIEISLFDDSAPLEKRALYSNVRHDDFESAIAPFEKSLQVENRTWTVKFHPTPEYLSSHTTPYAWAIFVAGLMSTMLLALYVYSMKRHALAIERSNDTLATVLNSIDAAIAIVDSKDMRILAFNDVFTRYAETGAQEVAGARCTELAQMKPLPCGRFCKDCPVMIAICTGERARREIVLPGGDDTKKYIELGAYPVRDETGKAVQVVHVAQDITDRKQAENARIEEQQLQRISAERRLAESQLRMLQAQIEPHFLFNTLANVVSLIDKDPKSAKEMLQHITTSLRLSLRRSRENVTTLDQEAELLRSYLSIFKMRLGSRLDFIIDIPGDLLELPFPPMLLQPLVENSVIHGIEPKVEGGRIEIRAERSNGFLRISVSDTGLGFSDPVNANGFGLENVKARLHGLYKNAGLILEENTPRGVIATIEVPL